MRSSKSRSTAVNELNVASRTRASDLVVTSTSSQVMPLKAGSPHVALVPDVAVGSPATSVPDLSSWKTEYVTGAGGSLVPSPFCVPPPPFEPAKAFPKIFASKVNNCAIGSLNSNRFALEVAPKAND